MPLRKDDLIFPSEMSLYAPAIHETIRFSDGFFWQSVAVNSWIPSVI